MDERVTRQLEKQNKNTRARACNKMATEGNRDIQELAKRRRSRQKQVTVVDFSSNNSVNGKQDQRTKFVCELEENYRENKVKRRNEQSRRRYGMIVEDISIDMEEIVCDIQNGKLSLEALPKLGLFPLHEAVARGLTKCAESLIGLGLQITSETPDGLTPLEVAVMAGNFDTAALLIQYGAPIDRIRDGIPRFV